MSFWKSTLGELSGTEQDAFSQSFRQIPDGTMALAKIDKFTNEEFNGSKYLKVDWLLTDGEFKGQHVFQKIHVFDTDEKKRHRALNMLMLVYRMFSMSPTSSNPPSDEELAIFKGKLAGIRIQETAPNDHGRQYNWVSQVKTCEGFVCATGESVIVTHMPSSLSSFANGRTGMDLDGDLPF